MNIRNFTRYTPEQTDVPGAMYLKSEDGRDWYDCRGLFAADTLKVVYNPQGVITDFSVDVSVLWPDGMSVADVPDTEENRKIDRSGRWGFDGEKITDRLTVETALARKTAEINAWRDSQEQGNVVFEVEGYSWDASLASKTRIEPVMALVTAGALPEGFFWTDANNEDIPATAELMTAIYSGMQAAMVEQGFKIHERQRQMKQEVVLLTTVAEIEAFAVGW